MKSILSASLSLIACAILFGNANVASAQSHFDRPDRRDGRFDRDRDHRRDRDRNRDRRRDDRRGDRLRPGETVWTDNGYTAVVMGVFPDGRVSVKINGYTQTLDRARLASDGCNALACSTDAVWTDNGYTGVLNGFFLDGSYSLKINGYNSKYAPNRVATEGCLAGLCSGDTVVTRNGYQGLVNGFFFALEVPSASVKINGYNQKQEISSLARVREPGERDPLPPGRDYDRYPTSGEQAWTKNGYTGVVNGVFPDGKVSVKVNGYNQSYNRQDVALAGCYRRLCSNDRVTTTTGYTGVVNGIFPDGMVSVKINGYNQTYRYEQLAK